MNFKRSLKKTWEDNSLRQLALLGNQYKVFAWINLREVNTNLTTFQKLLIKLSAEKEVLKIKGKNL